VSGGVEELGTRPGNGKMQQICIGHHPLARLLLTSISTRVQQELASRKVGLILPEYSSEEEEIKVKVSV
jgi:hypothetical protein